MNDTRASATASQSQPLEDGDMLAAIDLGSNSYHMVVARYTLGQLRVVDRLRETVRMAEGLDAKGGLVTEVRQRALQCLARFGQRIRDIPPHRVRAIATNTVRRLAAPQAFLMPAETALGHAIEVVAGREEARLVYLGVAHAQPPKNDQRRLVIDVGGGSTECIIGRGFTTIERESVQVGSIATTRRFFSNGRLSRRKWRDALIEVSAEFQQFASAYRSLGWHEAIGTSGTSKAIGEICATMKLTKGAITAEALATVRERLLRAELIDDIDLPSLSADRRPIIAGGLLALEAAFDTLGLQRMMVSKAALREGVLYDMLGRAGDADPREASIAALVLRYGIDQAQGARVAATALALFDQVAAAWSLSPDDRLMLDWAAQLHELGLSIAHSQYQVHGAYVVEYSDIAGFSRQEQQFLAALVRTHRRKVPKSAFEALPDRLLPEARRLAILLRLAVLLHRGHEEAHIPGLRVVAEGSMLSLDLPTRWLGERPLLQADLDGEPGEIGALGIVFRMG
ncbi:MULTISPECIES: Ppx/GppA phosphatase family protein [unclassified Luteimonas]|uniref:Ppx/GppA phosphatase family protein n=1 Tax=unclassified Luteimonas TaxID=2629088 RepID=UPI001603B100|nr:MULTISPECIES: Ppx/GppA phosphatase family protein [unclassified Luteimonas]MBB1471468.1 Ppx/GppA family phosphatase [Luteimonas sp. MC1782]MBB6599793.1 Ppx/GppA family phosphatase [Luteimonas sp. MC1825]QOC87468.1 Ppx/GppA family phosphatase [Luteimonas sp. MC1825]